MPSSFRLLPVLLLITFVSVCYGESLVASCARLQWTTGGVVTGAVTDSKPPCSKRPVCETNFTNCVNRSSIDNCTARQNCLAAKATCLNAASDNTTNCLDLQPLHMSLLKVASGLQMYNQSDAFQMCLSSACSWLNQSTNNSYAATNTSNSSLCDYSVDDVCSSPIATLVSLFFLGKAFPKLMRNNSQRVALAEAIARDYSRGIRFLSKPSRMFIAGTKRRETTEEGNQTLTLFVEMRVPGVSSQYIPFYEAASKHYDDMRVPSKFELLFPESIALYRQLTGDTLTSYVRVVYPWWDETKAPTANPSTVAPPLPPLPPTNISDNGTTSSSPHRCLASASESPSFVALLGLSLIGVLLTFL